MAQAFEGVASRIAAERPSLRRTDGFARFLVDRLPAKASDPVEWLAKLHAGDFLLAWACLEGQPEALRIFEEELMPQVEKALRRVDRAVGFVREASNVVRARLLMAEGARVPGLARYLGQGPLASFAMVIALREAAGLKRKPGVGVPMDDAVLGLADSRTSADNLLGRKDFQPAVQRALADAMAALTPRQRTLLRLHLVQNVSADKLGTAYGVHRTTASKWITDARQQVLASMTAQLKIELKLSAATFASLKAELVAGVDVTLSGLL